MLSLTATPKTITGTVLDTKHAGHSRNNNPAYDVTILLSAIDGTPVEGTPALRTVIVRTAPNSGLSYGIDNSIYAYRGHTYTLNRWGKLTNAVEGDGPRIA